MKLKNKKTGEIKDVESLGHEKSLRDKYGLQITLSWNTEYENLGECKTYNSLAELNEDWEDYKEAKDYWYIAGDEGEIYVTEDKEWQSDRNRKSIGNYFETREEAEKAVEKLKAWKRLKDKGFRLSAVVDSFFCLNIYMKGEPYEEIKEDLKIVFGGKE